MDIDIEETNVGVDLLPAWVMEYILPVLIIVAAAILIRRFGITLVEKFIRKIIKPSRYQTDEQHQQREQTLVNIFHSGFSILVWIVAGILIINSLGINLQPLLAAGGITAIVIGFGAQKIMQDIFAGIYVVIEHQYQVGDVVDLDGDVGLVEDISLRMTQMRDLDGTVHHVPHGSINRVKNLSKDYARVNLDVGVSYDSDIEHVIDVVNRVGKELGQDKDWRDKINSPPQFMRVNGFDDSSIDIKIIGETKTLQQWDVAGEYRKRLKKAFDKEGIKIPFPQRVIHQANKSKGDNNASHRDENSNNLNQ
ncbi:MAG: mechanosensitive ion channel family protein [Candidatus Saccharimonadales bacterium]